MSPIFVFPLLFVGCLLVCLYVPMKPRILLTRLMRTRGVGSQDVYVFLPIAQFAARRGEQEEAARCPTTETEARGQSVSRRQRLRHPPDTGPVTALRTDANESVRQPRRDCAPNSQVRWRGGGRGSACGGRRNCKPFLLRPLLVVLLCGKSQSTAKLSKLSGGGGGGSNNNKWTALISLGKDQVRFVQSSSPCHSLGRSLAPLFRDWPSAVSGWRTDGQGIRRVDSEKSDYFCHFIKYECFGQELSDTKWMVSRSDTDEIP